MPVAEKLTKQEQTLEHANDYGKSNGRAGIAFENKGRNILEFTRLQDMADNSPRVVVQMKEKDEFFAMIKDRR